MKRTFVAGVVLSLAAGYTSATPGAQAVKLTPVSATFRCTGAFTVAVDAVNPCMNGDPRWDTVAGDTSGAYVGVPATKKQPASGAFIDASGQFYFVVHETDIPARHVFVDLSTQLSGTADLKHFSTAWSNRLEPPTLSGPVDTNGNLLPNGLWGMQAGVSYPGKFKLDFQNTVDAYRWTVRLNHFDYPASDNVTILCTGTNGGKCNAWTIAAAPGSKAQLIASTTSGKYITYDEGTYAMAFQINITQP
jgi:hypothetical protein